MNKNEYARSNKEWLAGKAKEDGVTQLAKGVCYKVLQSGPEGGKQPTPNSVVSCHYLGRTIDGKCFDTSLGGYPLAIRLRDLIEGWVIALQQMRVGGQMGNLHPVRTRLREFLPTRDSGQLDVDLRDRTARSAVMVRKATEKDIPAAMELFTAAKSIMRSDGNSTQWGDGYPDAGIVRTDISMGGAHIIEQDGKPVAYFALLPSPEPTYSSIDGKWLDDSSPYHVIHRIASTPESHGVFRRIIEYALSVSGNLRIDTHRDNRIMRHLIEKAGFSYCGVIVLADGSERLAYQKITQR